MLHLVNSYERLLGKSAVIVQISSEKYVVGLFLAKTIPNSFEYTLKFVFWKFKQLAPVVFLPLLLYIYKFSIFVVNFFEKVQNKVKLRFILV